MAGGGSFGFLEGDSEDELPSGWEERTTGDGLVFYVNHQAKATQWMHPRSGKRKRLTGCLPHGWTQTTDEQGRLCYTHSASGQMTYTDPRLAYAVEDNPHMKPPDPGSRYLKRRFDAFTSARQVLQGIDLTDKYVCITGGSSGVGRECVVWLLAHKAHVTCLARRPVTSDLFGTDVDSRLHFVECDLASLQSVRRAAANYERLGWPLHYLICCAGVFNAGHSVTLDGYERTFQVNCLSHVYLIRCLKQTLINSRPARVTLVTCESHRFLDEDLSDGDDVRPETINVLKPQSYWCWQSYNMSKLCLLWATCIINQRLRNRGVTVTAAHPGNALSTGLFSGSWLHWLLVRAARPFSKSTEQAAASVLHAAVCDDLHEMGGGYYVNNCWLCQPSPAACSTQLQDMFWTVLVGMLNGFDERHGYMEQADEVTVPNELLLPTEQPV